MNNIIPLIGLFSPFIIAIINCLSLWSRPKYLAAYILFFFIGVGINKILKQIIRQDRPIGGKSISDWENYEGTERYGMPSAHSQSVAYSIAFLYWVTGSVRLLLVELFLAALMLYQRWSFHRHTWEQLGVGLFVGAFIGGFSVYLTDVYLRKRIRS